MTEAPEVSAARLLETSYRFPSLKKGVQFHENFDKIKTKESVKSNLKYYLFLV